MARPVGQRDRDRLGDRLAESVKPNRRIFLPGQSFLGSLLDTVVRFFFFLFFSRFLCSVTFR